MMNKANLRALRAAVCAVLVLLVSLVGAPTRRAAASDQVSFTVQVGGAFLRAQPSLIAPATQPVFANEVYNVVGRSADRAWVQLSARSDGGAWILAMFGAVHGDVSSVPVLKATLAPVKAAPVVQPKWVPAITARMRQIYLQSAGYGKDLSMFTVVGDCNSESTAYLGRLAAGTFQLPKGQEYLQTTITRFANAFPRSSLATHGSFGTTAMFDSTWSDPSQCRGNEGPLACELRVSKASIVFIALGTGDQYEWQDFEANYRAVVNYTLKSGALPVLVTKADDLETHSKAASGYINDVIHRLGK